MSFTSIFGFEQIKVNFYIIKLKKKMNIVAVDLTTKRLQLVTCCQSFEFEIRRNHGKKFYKRRVYESVDSRSLSLVIYLKNRWKTEFRG